MSRCRLCRKRFLAGTQFHPTVAGPVCQPCGLTPLGRDAIETHDEKDRRLFGSSRPPQTTAIDVDALYPRSLRPEDAQ